MSQTPPVDLLRAELEAVGTARFTAPDYKPGTIVHIVLFRFKADVSEADRDDVKRRFLALKHEGRRDGRPYIKDIVAGAQSSGEGAERGFEMAFVVRFSSEGDRNFYVGAPIVADPAYCDQQHQAFKSVVGPRLDRQSAGVLVFDFRAESASVA